MSENSEVFPVDLLLLVIGLIDFISRLVNEYPNKKGHQKDILRTFTPSRACISFSRRRHSC